MEDLKLSEIEYNEPHLTSIRLKFGDYALIKQKYGTLSRFVEEAIDVLIKKKPSDVVLNKFNPEELKNLQQATQVLIRKLSNTNRNRANLGDNEETHTNT